MDILLGEIGTTITVLTLLIINRIFLGLPGYNFFSPLIIAYIISFLGITHPVFTMILCSTIFGWIGHKIIIRYINLSLYTRYLLYYLISIASFIIMISAYLQIYNHNIIIDQYTLFGFISIVHIMQRIYSVGKGYDHRARWLHIIRFLILGYISTLILTSHILQNFFILYPFAIIGLSCFAILISNYEGLQVKEMIRFRKLIRSKITYKKKRL